MCAKLKSRWKRRKRKLQRLWPRLKEKEQSENFKKFEFRCDCLISCTLTVVSVWILINFFNYIFSRFLWSIDLSYLHLNIFSGPRPLTSIGLANFTRWPVINRIFFDRHFELRRDFFTCLWVNHTKISWKNFDILIQWKWFCYGCVRAYLLSARAPKWFNNYSAQILKAILHYRSQRSRV